jgi:hypothetical protein
MKMRRTKSLKETVHWTSYSKTFTKTVRMPVFWLRRGGQFTHAAYIPQTLTATPEQMKAMNKSYQESGGTVLSTNWNEIGKEETPVKPPDGMEFKKWS